MRGTAPFRGVYLLVLLCVGVGFLPSLVFIDQLRFLDDLTDAAEAASLLLDLRNRFKVLKLTLSFQHWGLTPRDNTLHENVAACGLCNTLSL